MKAPSTSAAPSLVESNLHGLFNTAGTRHNSKSILVIVLTGVALVALT
jgi:hypothetical protein